jgi:DNA-binding protein YbaB
VPSQEAFVNPQQWLDEYEAKLADLKKKSEDLQENFAASSATVTSKDGSVTVTVGPNGGLQNLQLGRRAMEMSAAQLTGAILQTAALAQRQAAVKVLEVFQPLGEGTEAMAMVSDAIPAEEVDLDEDEDIDEVEEPVAPPPVRAPAPVAPVVRPPTRPRPAADDADDDNQPW